MEDLDFTLELANCMITLASVDTNGEISANQQQLPFLALQGVELLDKVIAFAPGITQAFILKARALHLFARTNEAHRVIQRYQLSNFLGGLIKA